MYSTVSVQLNAHFFFEYFGTFSLDSARQPHFP